MNNNFLFNPEANSQIIKKKTGLLGRPLTLELRDSGDYYYQMYMIWLNIQFE